jgi:hypothetical protein
VRSPAGVTWSAGTTKFHLDRAAEDYTKTIEEWSESGDRRIVRITDHPLIELSSMDDEEEVPLLIREAERHTGIPGE